MAIMIGTYDGHKRIVMAYYPDENVYRLYKKEASPIKRIYKISNNRIAQLVSVQGYKSEIKLLVVINISDQLIDRVILLEEHESADYGAYISQDWFLERFKKKSAEKPISINKIREEKDNDVVIVTGATISSAAVVYGVNLCIDHYQSMTK